MSDDPGGDLFGDAYALLGVGNVQGDHLFCTSHARRTYGVPPIEVTPSMVADALEKIG